MKTTKEQKIGGVILSYFSNSINTFDLMKKLGLNGKTEDEVSEILKEAQKDWNDAPCDNEGATREQDAKLDLIIENTVTQLIQIIKSVEIGYTLTECYKGNANFRGLQKQIVLKENDKLIPFHPNLNVPSDFGRTQTYYKISEISEETFNELMKLKANLNSDITPINYIGWQSARFLKKKDYKKLTNLANDYNMLLAELFEPINYKIKNRYKRAIKKIIKQNYNVNLDINYIY